VRAGSAITHKLKEALEDIAAQPRAAAADAPATRRAGIPLIRRGGAAHFGDGFELPRRSGSATKRGMKHADRVLGDQEIVAAIYEALAKRIRQTCPQRPSGPR